MISNLIFFVLGDLAIFYPLGIECNGLLALAILLIALFLLKRKPLWWSHSLLFCFYCATGSYFRQLHPGLAALIYVATQFAFLGFLYTLRRQRYLFVRNARFLLPFVILLVGVSFIERLDSVYLWGFVILLFVFYPFIVCKMWGCKKIGERLGIKLMTWPVFNHVANAAMVGSVPYMRYILVTRPLFEQLHADELEAVIAHEIGHHYHKHLLFYPVLLLGLYLSLDFIVETVIQWPLPFVEAISFVCALGWIVIYVRFVMGFFMRLFERQADFYPLKTGINHLAVENALTQIARIGKIPMQRNDWHHYNPKERIEAVRWAAENPSLIKSHDKRSFWYRLIFSLVVAVLYIVSESYG